MDLLGTRREKVLVVIFSKLTLFNRESSFQKIPIEETTKYDESPLKET